MQWQFKTGYSDPLEKKRNTVHATMESKNDTKLPISDYLYAVNDLHFKPLGVELFVGSNKSILSDRIPEYQFPD